MSEVANSCNFGVYPRTSSWGDGFEKYMHAEFIVRSLSEYTGDAAACLLLYSIPDLQKLQLQILHIHLIFRRLQNNRDVIMLENKFRDILDQLQDSIDHYVLGSGYFSKGNSVVSSLIYSFYKLLELKSRRNLRREIQVLGVQLKLIAKNFELCVTKKVVNDEQVKEWSKHDQFVGRAEDLKKLKSFLLDNTWEKNYTHSIVTQPRFVTVAIVGVDGIGKTRLANELFSELRTEFECFGWLNFSNRRAFDNSLLQGLIMQLTMESREKVMSLSRLRLELQLIDITVHRKCLIVIDDLWSKDDWLSLLLFLPLVRGCTSSRFLITTRSKEMAEMVARRSGIVHVLNGFSEDESWEIIARKALHPGIKSDAFMELIGKEIARKCNHIPLAISFIGEHLGRKRTLGEWRVLNKNLVLDNWKGEQERDGIQQLLALIFMDLPVNLKHCLLYLAVFLENSVIDTDKLYMLWIAEGLVQSRYGESTETLIGIADCYLQELASRGMVEVEENEISRVRKFRSCHLNSMIRDMSLLIAKEEKYLTVMDLRRSKQSTSCSYEFFSTHKVRKIAVHLGGDKGPLSISFGQEKTDNVRSLLLLDTFPSQNNIFQEESLCMLKFKLLRVLDFDGLNFGAGKYPKQMDNLVFLRYLSFRNCYLEKLPSSISKLLNLQTLDLRVREGCSMTIPNLLRKMGRMKHLYLPQIFRVHNDEKLRLDGLRKLETLENFNWKLCCAQDLRQLISLRFLNKRQRVN